MPNSMNDAQARLALGFIITTGFFGTVFIVFFVPIASGVRDIALVLLGALIASFKEVTGFYFGASAGSAQKDATIRDLSNPIPPGPTDPAGKPIVKVETEPGKPLPVVEASAPAPTGPRAALMQMRYRRQA